MSQAPMIPLQSLPATPITESVPPTPAANSTTSLTSTHEPERSDRQDQDGFDGNADEFAALPPADRGKAAYLFLLAGYSLELITLGSAFSFGIFQEYLLQSPDSPLPPSTSPLKISSIGTLLFSMIYFAPALIRPVIGLYPQYITIGVWAALVVGAASLIVASFLTSSTGAMAGLVGFLHGTCAGLLVTPYMLWISQWFIKRRSLATGLVFSGAGMGGFIFPFIFTASLKNLGFAWTLRIWAVIFLVGGGTALLGVKPRFPDSTRRRGSGQDLDEGEHGHAGEDQGQRAWRTLRIKMKAFVGELSFVTSPLWILSALLTLAASAGYFAVSFYLALYCTSTGMSSTASSGAVSAFNAATLLGEIFCGLACDKFSHTYIICMIGVTSSLSSIFFWGFGRSLALVIVFTLLFGFSAGSFCSTWQATSLDIAKLKNTQSANILLSLTLMRGVAAIIGPLVASAIYEPWKMADAQVFGSYGFRSLIIFVGACMASVTVLGVLTEITKRVSFKGRDVRLMRETY